MTRSASRGIMIAAPRSGSGKTTVTIGLLRALRNRGLRATGLKCGPDYIDTAFHQAASDRPSLNLDSWAMSPDLVMGLAQTAIDESDIVVCEASMGLFDGVPSANGRNGSAADIAAILGLPVILVLDVSGQSQSAAATLKGFMQFDPRITIAGVILNSVASQRHSRLLRDGIAGVGVPILGELPRKVEIALPSRHLGLVQADDTADLDETLDALAAFVANHVALDQLLATAGDIRGADAPAPDRLSLRPPGQRIAIARDRAFSFMYQHILDDWRRAGAEVKPFSPLNDEPPPADCDVCWLPGGYPELHAGRLAAAARFLDGLREFAAEKPTHGECGGYMTLGETITDSHGTVHRMAGLLDLHTGLEAPKMQLGYRSARLAASGCLGHAGQILKGHEFHYARILSAGADDPFAFVTDAYGNPPSASGSRRGRVTGSFFHIVAAE